VSHDQGAHREEDFAPDEHRPADVDEGLVADERQVADRECRPRVAVTAAAEPDRAAAPDPGAEVRPSCEQLEVRPELREPADRGDLVTVDRRSRPEPDAVLEQTGSTAPTPSSSSNVAGSVTPSVETPARAW
jgi:hypothetical protein